MTASIIIAAVSTLAGIGLRYLIERASEWHRFKKELRDNNSIDVTGPDWHVAWQTSIDGKQLLNTERLSMIQTGNTVRVRNREKSRENPKGGYLWDAQMQFFQGRWMMGWYFPLKSENNTSKGIMFFCYHSPSRTFYGKWVGTAYDGDLLTGFAVISRDKGHSLNELSRIIAQPNADIVVISNGLIHG